jgi:DnaJ-class molecular chaperone
MNYEDDDCGYMGEDDSPDYEPGICPACNGSGEGRNEGTTCHTCKGEGEI